jgi:hypothetical protein
MWRDKQTKEMQGTIHYSPGKRHQALLIGQFTAHTENTNLSNLEKT